MPDRKSPRPKAAFGAAVRHALDHETLEVMLPAEAAAEPHVEAQAVTPAPAVQEQPAEERAPRPAAQQARTRPRHTTSRQPAPAPLPAPGAKPEPAPAQSLATAAAPSTSAGPAAAEPIASAPPDRGASPTAPGVESELERLRGEVDTLRRRLGRGAIERYEIPVLVVIAAILIAVIVIQLRG